MPHSQSFWWDLPEWSEARGEAVCGGAEENPEGRSTAPGMQGLRMLKASHKKDAGSERDPECR